MITVANNQKSDGAIVSSISFANASPYTNSSKGASIEVTQIADCVKTMKYKIYYGESETAVNSASTYMSSVIQNVGNVINFNKGDGYYKVVVTATDKNTETQLTKTYYAIVKFNSSSTSAPTLTLSKIAFSSANSTLKVSVSAKSDVGLSMFKYCRTNLQTGCTPNLGIAINNQTSYYEKLLVKYVSSGYKVCGIVYDINGNASKRRCVLIN